MLALWDSSRQREAYAWLTTELSNLRAAFSWALDHGDIDVGAAIAVYAGFLGGWIELHEPSTWAEDLVEAARGVDHHRLGQLYVIAAECYRTGRLDDAIEYADAAVVTFESDHFDRMLFDIEPTALGGTYITAGMADRWLALCRNRFARKPGMNPFNSGSMVMALMTSGRIDEALASGDDLLAAANAADNPCAAAFALMAYGYACRDDRPTAAYQALRRGLQIARDSGNRMTESYLAVNLSALARDQGTPADVLDFVTLAINNFYNSGSYSHMVTPLGVLASYFDRLGKHEAAATIVGFAATTFALAAFPELNNTIGHLREVLGDVVYDSLAAAGAEMPNASVARYALEQIDIARADLVRGSR